MKKQYQIVIAILVTGVFFCTNHDDNLKACGTNTNACATIQKKGKPKTADMKKETAGGYVEESDGGIYRFMNPFTQ